MVVIAQALTAASLVSLSALSVAAAPVHQQHRANLAQLDASDNSLRNIKLRLKVRAMGNGHDSHGHGANRYQAKKTRKQQRQSLASRSQKSKRDILLNLDILNLGGHRDYVKTVYTGHGNTVNIHNEHVGVARRSKNKLQEHNHNHNDGGHHHFKVIKADAVINLHSHHRRQDSGYMAGTPGFIEVASTLFHSNLAKSVAGLVFSKDPESNSSDFMLGTSDSHSTQFYLAPINGTALTAEDAANFKSLTATSVNGTTFNSTDSSNSTRSTPGVAMYQLRVPILNSQTLSPEDYCASFDVKPPSPLSMLPCGDIAGFSQAFTYNDSTGQVIPVYPAKPESPLTSNGAIKMSRPRIAAALDNSSSRSASTSTSTTESAFITASTESASSASSSIVTSSATSSSTSAEPSASTTAEGDEIEPASAPVSLYFVPSTTAADSKVVKAGVAPQLANLPVSLPSPANATLPVNANGTLPVNGSTMASVLSSLPIPAPKINAAVSESSSGSTPSVSVSSESLSASGRLTTITITATITTDMSRAVQTSAPSMTTASTTDSIVASASSSTSVVARWR